MPVVVSEPVVLDTGVYSTGELTTGVIEEQSLIIDTDDGLLIITGCSHPGIIDIVQAAQDICSRPVYQVCGGFHLLQHSAGEIQQVISELQALGVEKVGPSHCTGDLAISMFEQAYGENCIALGVGAILHATVAAVSVDEAAENPEIRSLRMNSAFPNPFNPQTTIRYAIAGPQRVRMAVYNVEGRLIDTLVEAEMSAGLHEVSWNGRDSHGREMPSGSYLVRLETENGAEARKVSLIR